jgi:replicative DNA helicase
MMWTLEMREERERQEMALVGAMLLDERMAAVLADDILPTEIFDSRLRIIFRAAQRLLDEGASTDPERLIAALYRRGLLKQAGGAHFILELAYKGGTPLEKALAALWEVLASMPRGRR